MRTGLLWSKANKVVNAGLCYSMMNTLHVFGPQETPNSLLLLVSLHVHPLHLLDSSLRVQSSRTTEFNNHSQRRTSQLVKIFTAARERDFQIFQLTQVKIQDAPSGGRLVRFRREWRGRLRRERLRAAG